jgi:putative addiction module killer protein
MRIEFREYVAVDGGSPFGDWFGGLDPVAAAKVTTALARLRAGNVSSIRSVGRGVFEYRVDFGLGYRI